MNFFIVTLFGFFIAVQASPLFAPSLRDTLEVYNPPIISPNSSTTWCTNKLNGTPGRNEIVIWNITDPSPPPNTSNVAAILLNYPNQTSILLAAGFNLRDGSQTVTVPAGTPPGQYTITLLAGDPGNRSQQFSIINCLVFGPGPKVG